MIATCNPDTGPKLSEGFTEPVVVHVPVGLAEEVPVARHLAGLRCAHPFQEPQAVPTHDPNRPDQVLAGLRFPDYLGEEPPQFEH